MLWKLIDLPAECPHDQLKNSFICPKQEVLKNDFD